jgi:hypothetical protein
MVNNQGRRRKRRWKVNAKAPEPIIQMSLSKLKTFYYYGSGVQ